MSTRPQLLKTPRKRGRPPNSRNAPKTPATPPTSSQIDRSVPLTSGKMEDFIAAMKLLAEKEGNPTAKYILERFEDGVSVQTILQNLKNPHGHLRSESRPPRTRPEPKQRPLSAVLASLPEDNQSSSSQPSTSDGLTSSVTVKSPVKPRRSPGAAGPYPPRYVPKKMVLPKLPVVITVSGLPRDSEPSSSDAAPPRASRRVAPTQASSSKKFTDAPSSSSESSLEQSRADFFAELDIADLAGPEFMEKFSHGERVYMAIQKDKSRVHRWTDGINYMRKLGKFDEVHLFDSTEGLGLVVPALTFDNLKEYLDLNNLTPVINSYTQKTTEMKMETFLKKFVEEKRGPPRNTLATEITKKHPRLNEAMEVPQFVRDHSLVNKLEDYWNEEIARLENGRRQDKETKIETVAKKLTTLPRLQKYLILSMKDSFTSIHIDFSASCVYYHVVVGQKIFYVAPPTKENLAIYAKYMLKKNEDDTWIGEKLADEWERVEINAGQTALIPAGWIHFVYTPVDSIVFGGNFLMEKFLEQHFEATSLEEECVKIGTLKEHELFQGYRFVMWYYLEMFLIPELQRAQADNNLTADCVAIGRLFVKNLDLDDEETDVIKEVDARESLLKKLEKIMESFPDGSDSQQREADDAPSTSAPKRRRVN